MILRRSARSGGTRPWESGTSDTRDEGLRVALERAQGLPTLPARFGVTVGKMHADGLTEVGPTDERFGGALADYLKDEVEGVVLVRERGAGNQSRWTDNPFREPNLSPEQTEWLDKRDEAFRIYRETGDRGPAVELGLFNPEPPGRERTERDE